MAPFKKVGRLPLTDECRHYTYQDEVPWEIQKYWHQRYSIFSYYDHDIRLTDDAWFGVTPEPVATIADDLGALSPPGRTTLVDMFGGAGGNAIAFALSGRWRRVVAVERDAAVLACAQHNAAAYGVPDDGRLVWVLGDCFEYLKEAWDDGDSSNDSSEDDSDSDSSSSSSSSNDDGGHRLDPELRIHPSSTVLFASPPWGGVGYRDHDVFDLESMEPYGLDQLHRACRGADHALYLPRTSDLRQIAGLQGGEKERRKGGDQEKKIEVVQYCMQGASKAMVAYVPGSRVEK